MAARLGTGKARIGAVIAVAGVACALAVMLLTWGISCGFNTRIKEKLMGFEPEISISAPYSYVSGNSGEFVTYSPEIDSIVKAIVPSANAVVSMRQPAIIKTDTDFEAVVMCGFGSGRDRSFEKGNIVEGRFPDYTTEDGDTTIVLSRRIAGRLGLNVGDRVTTCYFINDAIRSRRYTLVGIYESGFGEFDATVAYGSLKGLQRLNRVDSLTGTSIELKGTRVALDTLPSVAKRIQEALVKKAYSTYRGEVEVVDNLANSSSTHLNWLDLIETNVWVIFIIMCIVASLTMVSSLFIIVLDRIPTIGLMRAMGADKPKVRNIFMFIAMRLVLFGVVIGDMLALGFGWLQERFGIIRLDADMYYLDRVYVEFDWLAIILINIGVLMLAWTTLIIPAHVASAVSPAKTIRYE